MNPQTNSVVLKIADIIRDSTGWKITDRDLKKLFTAINRRMSVCKINDMEEYYRKLILAHSSHQPEFAQLISLFVNPETYFFRDKFHQNMLKQIILPKLINSRKMSREIRIWSAGCSSGEEPYSIAIILDSLLPANEHWNVNIIGTDINLLAIDKAKKGIYGENSLRSVESKDRQRYFKNDGKNWILLDKYLQMVHFQEGNLVTDIFPSPLTELKNMDLIVCRNVFIYFQHAAIVTVATKFTKTLRSGGILLTGHGELSKDDVPELKSELLPEAFIFTKP